MFIRAGIHKMFVKIANMEDLKQSDLDLLCLSRQVTTNSVQNFRTFTLYSLVCINCISMRDYYKVFS